MSRPRLTYANVVATLALVFAMSGGALAASKFIITSTKQIKPSVLASLKGKAGPAGAAGAQGPAGPQGPAGKDGVNGNSGKDGLNGKDGATGQNGVGATSKTFTGKKTLGSEKCEEGGTEVTSASGTTLVCNGKEGPEGPEGKEGALGTAGATLPKGATETGTWSFAGNGKVEQFAPVSFPIPLSKTAAEHIEIHISGETGFATHCPGTPDEPAAGQGELCLYLGPHNFSTPNNAFTPDGSHESHIGETGEGVGQSGVLLYYENTPATSYQAGSFAVTSG